MPLAAVMEMPRFLPPDLIPSDIELKTVIRDNQNWVVPSILKRCQAFEKIKFLKDSLGQRPMKNLELRIRMILDRENLMTLKRSNNCNSGATDDSDISTETESDSSAESGFSSGSEPSSKSGHADSSGHAPGSSRKARRIENLLSAMKQCRELSPLVDSDNPFRNEKVTVAALQGIAKLTAILGDDIKSLGLSGINSIEKPAAPQIFNMEKSMDNFSAALCFYKTIHGKTEALLIVTESENRQNQKSEIQKGIPNEKVLTEILSRLNIDFILRPGQKEHPLRRIGIFFGTFDPVHTGHISTALCAQKYLGLDSVIMIPNYVSAHKPGATSFKTRHAILVSSISDIHELQTLPSASIARGFENGGVAGMVNQIRNSAESILTGEFETMALFQLMGTDSFEKLIGYGIADQVCLERTIAIVERPGYQFSEIARKFISTHNEKVVVIPARLVPAVSSTKIRKAIKTGIKTRFLKSGARVIIESSALYGGR
jgi:nicotinate-nucleotide adenylyltransferase